MFSKRTLLRLAGATAIAPVLPALPALATAPKPAANPVVAYVQDVIAVSGPPGASVVLPPPQVGAVITIVNTGEHPLCVFGTSQDKFELAESSCWEGVSWDGRSWLCR
jgi:hypothetical protein